MGSPVYDCDKCRMHQRAQKGCHTDGQMLHVAGEYQTKLCPKRIFIENSWIGTVWSSAEHVSLENSNIMYDAVSVANGVDGWRQRQEHEKQKAKHDAARLGRK